MAVTIPGKLDIGKGLFLNLLGFPERQYDAAFDSFLLLKGDGHENHTLTLVLKLHLTQPSTFGFPKFPYMDAGGTAFWIQPWKNNDWQQFQRTFKQQCMRWTNQFWLVPPAGFSKLDVRNGSRTVRPNIYCHLYIDFVGSGAGAHRAIEVVNLDKASALAQQGGPLDSGTFGSHEGLYDSLDVVPRTNVSQDQAGRTHRHAGYLTIVHEIGHALGLEHIGVLHNDPLCKTAILLDSISGINKAALPALFQQGANSQSCYGTFAAPERSENVMGRGTKFEAFNAQPWRDRIAQHTQTDASKWQVSLRPVHPQSV